MLTELQKLKQTYYFHLLDTDDNGMVEQADFEQLGANIAAWRGIRPGSPEYQKTIAPFLENWESLRRACDTDSDGRVMLEEFLSWRDQVTHLPEAAHKQMIERVGGSMFSGMDTDNDGYITLHEYMMMATSYNVLPRDAAEAFHHLDLDGSGKLTQDEFLQVVWDFNRSDDPNAPGNWMFGPVTGLHN